MKTTTILKFRSRIKEYLDEIEQSKDVLVLTAHGKKQFVVLTLELFNSIKETAYLLSTEANAKRLTKSIAQFKSLDLILSEPKPAHKLVKKVKRKNVRKN